jgi:hypothetical protein
MNLKSAAKKIEKAISRGWVRGLQIGPGRFNKLSIKERRHLLRGHAKKQSKNNKWQGVPATALRAQAEAETEAA